MSETKFTKDDSKPEDRYKITFPDGYICSTAFLGVARSTVRHPSHQDGVKCIDRQTRRRVL